MFNLLNNAMNVISSVMHYILIGTIVLGCLLALFLVILIVKRLKYNSQMKKNKTIRNKLIRNEEIEEEKTP